MLNAVLSICLPHVQPTVCLSKKNVLIELNWLYRSVYAVVTMGAVFKYFKILSTKCAGKLLVVNVIKRIIVFILYILSDIVHTLK